MITLVAAGSISLHRAFRVRAIAKKYNLISLNLDAKNSIKDGSASFVGFSSVLAGYFGIPYMDAIGSMIIAGYIFYMAYQAFKESTLVLVDAVKNPEMEDQIARYVEQKFDVNVDDVLIRPLGHAFSAQLHVRSEEHTSELQSRQYLVCRLLLEQKTHDDGSVRPPARPPTIARRQSNSIPARRAATI